jgi:hypothetical protein
MKKTLSTTVAAALFGIGALVATTGTASAYVACNRSGDCWHTEQRYNYRPSIGVQIHSNDWYFHRNWAGERNRHWRGARNGRGYYRNGVWLSF